MLVWNTALWKSSGFETMLMSIRRTSLKKKEEPPFSIRGDWEHSLVSLTEMPIWVQGMSGQCRDCINEAWAESGHIPLLLRHKLEIMVAMSANSRY
jgi:hypothetical protein